MRRPDSDERLNHGAPTTPRRSASVILLRDGDGDIEVLLVRRNPLQRFMGGFWVFPGGAVETADGDGHDDGDAAHRAAAVRELAEEAGIEGVAPAQLVRFSRWITPELIEKRFDTHFYVARAPVGARPRADGRECVDLGWYRPQAALDGYERDELPLVFPTLRHLQELTAFATARAVLEHAAGLDIRPVRPRVVLRDGIARVLLPGEPGYDGPQPEAVQ